MTFIQRYNMVEAAYTKKCTWHYKALEKIRMKPIVRFRQGKLFVIRGSKEKSAPARALRVLGRLKFEKFYGDEMY